MGRSPNHNSPPDPTSVALGFTPPTDDAFRSWLYSAALGETFTYHVGPWLDGSVASLAYAAYEASLVTLVQRRAGPSNFAYIAIRR